MRKLKKLLLSFSIILTCLLSYASIEYLETRRIVKTIINHQIDASFHIREFDKIHRAKNLQQLQHATEKTLIHLNKNQQTLNSLTLFTPQTNHVRHEYQKGVIMLQNNLDDIKNSKNPQNLEKLKQQILKSEKTLLNAREKLFQLSDRYLLSIHLKMG